LPADGLVVLIVLPIREVMLGLIRLFVLRKESPGLLVVLFVIVFRELSTGRLTVLLDRLLVPIELPIPEVKLELILLFELLLSELEELLRLLMLLRLEEFDRVVI
jgi:hypothetical protein